MFAKKRNQMRDERLDRAGSELVRAAGLSASETDAVASSPFLYARVRARIEAGKRSGSPRIPALAIFSSAWRAVPALAIVAIVAVSAFWAATPVGTGATPPTPAPIDNVNLIATGGTCALSNAAECAISTEEVLATLFDEEREAER